MIKLNFYHTLRQWPPIACANSRAFGCCSGCVRGDDRNRLLEHRLELSVVLCGSGDDVSLPVSLAVQANANSGRLSHSTVICCRTAGPEFCGARGTAPLHEADAGPNLILHQVRQVGCLTGVVRLQHFKQDDMSCVCFLLPASATHRCLTCTWFSK